MVGLDRGGEHVRNGAYCASLWHRCRQADHCCSSLSQAANGGRAYSHEVTSGGKGRERALTMERRNQIAGDLQNALGELSEEQLNGEG